MIITAAAIYRQGDRGVKAIEVELVGFQIQVPFAVMDAPAAGAVIRLTLGGPARRFAVSELSLQDDGWSAMLNPEE